MAKNKDGLLYQFSNKDGLTDHVIQSVFSRFAARPEMAGRTPVELHVHPDVAATLPEAVSGARVIGDLPKGQRNYVRLD